MPIWEVRSQPGITLVRWRVFETELKERHLVGYCLETHKGRVSSAVQSFNTTTRLAVTRSGRAYELVGPPSQDLDALYVWRVPRRPKPLNVPIHKEGTIPYVRMREIPEPARSIFKRRMLGATVPVIAGERDCVYAWDWRDFIGG